MSLRSWLRRTFLPTPEEDALKLASMYQREAEHLDWCSTCVSSPQESMRYRSRANGCRFWEKHYRERAAEYAAVGDR